MAIPAPSLPSQRLRPRLRLRLRIPARLARFARRPNVPVRLKERRDAVAQAWGSPARFLVGLVVCTGLALLVSGIVLALVIGSSLMWAALLIPCLAGWYGLVNEFFLRRPAPEPKPVKRTRTRKTAASAEAAPRQRKTPATPRKAKPAVAATAAESAPPAAEELPVADAV